MSMTMTTMTPPNALPISSLDPTASAPPSNTSITGLITLLWPYSSSTHTCAFLLADRDSRLRRRGGQVRVRFAGPGARAVARARVGIGDLVEVGLEGACWEEDRERARTPGSGVEGQLVFARSVGLRVWREGVQGGEAVVVEVDAPREEEEGGVECARDVSTPVPRLAREMLRASVGGVREDGWVYASPAFAKRVRLSAEGGFLDSAFDPFVDEEGGGGLEKSKRTSFGRELRWRYQERDSSVSSPTEQTDAEAVMVDEMVSSTSKKSMEQEQMQDVQNVAMAGAAPSEGDRVRSASPTSPSPASLSSGAIIPARSPVEVPKAPTSAEPALSTMPPPPNTPPRLRTSSEIRTQIAARSATPTHAKSPTTPKLQPIQSPSLPLPSSSPAAASDPVTTAVAPAYTANSLFGALGSAAAVIERRRRSGRDSSAQGLPAAEASLPPSRRAKVTSAPVVVAETKSPSPRGKRATSPQTERAPEPAVPATIDFTDDEDEEMLDNAAAVQETNVMRSFSTTEPDEEMYDDLSNDALGRTHSGGQVPSPDRKSAGERVQRATSTGPLHVGEIWQDNEEEDRVSENGSVVAEAVVYGNEGGEEEEAQPPTKLPTSALSLDGTSVASPESIASHRRWRPDANHEDCRAAELELDSTDQLTTPRTTSQRLVSAPAGAHVTPEAERERMRKTTYRSLFGLGSPRKDSQTTMVDEQEERYIPGWFFEVTQQQDVAKGAEGRLEEGGTSIEEVKAEEPAEVESRNSDLGIFRIVSQQPAAFEKVIQPSRMEIIELDASSDVEDSEGEVTSKPAATELLSSSRVIQDSLEDSQTETSPVSGDRSGTLQRGPGTEVQNLKDQMQTETSRLSSPVADEDSAALRRQASGVSGALTQEVDGLVMSSQVLSPPLRDTNLATSPTPKTSDLPAFEQAVEAHIAPPRSTAAVTVLEPEPSPRSESSPTRPITRSKDLPKPARGESGSFEDTPPQQNQQSTTQPSKSHVQQPSHPRLPLSPSNSQSLQDMHSQPVFDKSVSSKLPPTPQLTQRESSTRTEERNSQKTPASKLLRSESSLLPETRAAESPITPQTKTPSRRSARLRRSNVPDVLSEWFSPRSSGVVSEGGRKALQIDDPSGSIEAANGTVVRATNGHAHAGEAAGFATSHSYFTPLSKLPEFVNPSSQSAHGASTLDILAAVTNKTKDPVRAKTGPRDYYTTFRVSDPSMSPAESIRVEVFRPYKNTLPAAEAGDVVLLRAFVVKSKKRTPYLLSTETSAWCVWRYPDESNAGKPVWARRGSVENVAEGVKGPPVEFGEEERSRSRVLRRWWSDSQRADGRMVDDDDDDDLTDGKTVQDDVFAKL